MANTNTQTPIEVVNEVAQKLDALWAALKQIARERPEMESYCRDAAECSSEMAFLLSVVLEEEEEE